MPAASSTTPLIPAVASTDGPEPTDCARSARWPSAARSEEHTSELQSQSNLVCRLLLEKKKPRNPTCHVADDPRHEAPALKHRPRTHLTRRLLDAPETERLPPLQPALATPGEQPVVPGH